MNARQQGSTVSPAAQARGSGQRVAERWTALTLLAVVGGFQLALVTGAPWGAAAWGGLAPGVLPMPLRIASLASLVIYCGLGGIVASPRLHPTTRRRLLTGASLVMVLGTIGNVATQSPAERIWAPVSAALAVLLWRLRTASV